jgi:outer membrane protein assembly factor BamB
MKPRYVLLALALLALVGLFLGYRWASATPQVRSFEPPQKTAWAPAGARKTGNYDFSVIPQPDAFHTMHVGVNNTDELWTVAAPMVEHDWVAETEFYVAEGPTFDNEGNLYFSPYNPTEDVSLISLDRETGKRRWSVPGRGAGCGAILILNDPEAPGNQLIYHSTYTTAMALRPDGSVVWKRPTGLQLPERAPGERDYTHVWGMNYHPQADAVFGVTMDGYVYAHDRKTGAPLLAEPFQLPGAPAAIVSRPPAWISGPANRETDAVFGRTIDDRGLFTAIVDVILGSDFRIANFYGIDPNSGRLYIAATAPDEQDGNSDGVSQNGAVYLLELTGGTPADYALRVVRYYPFRGGTGSTPTISVNSDRVMLSDDNGNIFALDADLNELWRLDLGAQVVASVAVSVDNDEVYAVTKFDVFKIIDRGTAGEIAWRATLDAYPGFDNFNALTPTITANGLAISVGAGRQIGDDQIMTKVGVGLLDRETGKLRSFAEGREESIAITSIGPDGGFYIATSPVRRAAARGLFGDKVPPLVGGIQRYKPIRLDLLVRDAACAGAARARNARTIAAEHPRSAHFDLLQIGALLRQSRSALPLAERSNDLSPETRGAVAAISDQAEANLSIE